nr:glycerophosphodiester phosphodiesterase family protein [uncultured Desulfobulbus sp.]
MSAAECGRPPHIPDETLCIAHRGYRACFPENTLLAFAQSLGRSHMIELDVRLSRDGEVIVFHDELLCRTTNARLCASEWGLSSLQVIDWSLTELQRLDAGAWFLEADPFSSLGSKLVRAEDILVHLPQKIPTLDEVLCWSRKHAMRLNIELKDLAKVELNRLLVEAVIAALQRQQVEHLVLLSSFNHRLLPYCRGLAPDIACAALQEKTHPPELVAYLRDLQVCAYHPENALTDQALIALLWSAGIAVNVFTVNDHLRMKELAGFGVSGIITDYPHLSTCGQA